MTLTRLIILVVLTAVAVGVALALRRRRPDPPSAPSYRAPAQLDRDDFLQPPQPGAWLIVLFGSTTCDSCPRAWDTIQSVLGDGNTGTPVVTRRIDVQTDPDTHKRYRIDGVPTTVVADPDGVVHQSFFGPMSSGELAEALHDLGVLPSV